MKKQKNVIRFGKFLIEHMPSEDEPFWIWDLRNIFNPAMNEFRCVTRAEAESICNALEAIDRKTAQGRPV